MCKHKLTGVERVIKIFEREKMNSELETKFANEVAILKRLDHPNIIRLYEVFESEKHFLMVMEYASGGDLLQYVKKKKRLDEQQAKSIFR